MLLYTHPRDNLIRSAESVTLATGTPISSETDVEKLSAEDLGDPLMIDGTDLDVVIDHGVAVPMGLVAILHGTINVPFRVQRDNSDSWSDPAVDVEIAAPVMDARGIFSAPYADLSDEAAYRYTRIHVAENGFQITVGHAFLSRVTRRYAVPYEVTTQFGRRADTVTHLTTMRTRLAYDRSVGTQTLYGAVLVEGYAQRAEIEAWFDAARGMARPFLMVPEAKRDEAWFVRFAADDIAFNPAGAEVWRVALPVEHVAYGLPWIDPDAELES